jgi:sugar phosphate permease
MSLHSIDRSHDCTDASLAERRWIVLTLAWAAFTISTICRLAWGTVALSVSQSLELPIAALGTFATAFSFGYIASNAVSGLAADIVGGRRALTISLAGLALVTYGFGYTPSLMIGLALQALMGFAAGADYSAGNRLAYGCLLRRGYRHECHFTERCCSLWLAERLSLSRRRRYYNFCTVHVLHSRYTHCA